MGDGTHKADLENLDDLHLAEERLRDFRDGDAISLAEVKAELSLAD